MAKVLSEAGRYVTDQAVKHFRSQMTILLIVGFSMSAVGGTLTGASLVGRLPWWSSISAASFTVLLVYCLWKWSDRKINSHERKRLAMGAGVSGESIVAKVLARFPDEFYVINDFATSHGNLDHVIIGPTGVFAIDTKNWRGIVSADGKGELLCNGSPTDKPLIRRFVARVMETKEKIHALEPKLDLYFQAVFVFTAARVEAKWGSTRAVHCIRDDQLFNYFVERKSQGGLKRQEIERPAQAFLTVARTEQSSPVKQISNKPKSHMQVAPLATSVHQT